MSGTHTNPWDESVTGPFIPVTVGPTSDGLSVPARFTVHPGPPSEDDMRAMIATARRAFAPQGSEVTHGVKGFMRPQVPIIYLSGVLSPGLRPHLQRPDLGLLAQPGTMSYIHESTTVTAFDNGCFGAGEKFNVNRWYSAVERLDPTRTLFVVVPDVVADAEGTWKRSAPLIPVVREMGFNAAYVAQNGMTVDNAPWPDIDAIFIGGTDAWKLGPEARAIAEAAHEQGKWVHMGRVNSFRRLNYAHSIGCDSVDGTYLKYSLTENLPRLLGWLDKLSGQSHQQELVAANPDHIDEAAILPRRSLITSAQEWLRNAGLDPTATAATVTPMADSKELVQVRIGFSHQRGTRLLGKKGMLVTARRDAAVVPAADALELLRTVTDGMAATDPDTASQLVLRAVEPATKRAVPFVVGDVVDRSHWDVQHGGTVLKLAYVTEVEQRDREVFKVTTLDEAGEPLICSVTAKSAKDSLPHYWTKSRVAT